MAGGSAGERGRRAREAALELSRRARAAYAEAGRWEAASEAERQVAATLVGLTAIGWRLLVDRRWPGTHGANVDMILIGPAGVFVIDVKRWRDAPSVRDGALRAGRERRDGDVAKLLAMTRTAEAQVSALGMSPVALRPLMVFAGHRLDATLGRVRLLGHPDAVHALLREPRRLTRPMVRAVADHLEDAFPAYEAPALEERAASEPAGTLALFDAAEAEKAALESALRAPIEQWMTFLHPDQVAVARRDWTGPARISGPAGTGKTVVGLHRAAHLAARGHGRVLYVTFAKNLPRVQRQLFGRMAEHFADRVEFSGLHAWAQGFLQERGVPMHLDRGKGRPPSRSPGSTGAAAASSPRSTRRPPTGRTRSTTSSRGAGCGRSTSTSPSPGTGAARHCGPSTARRSGSCTPSTRSGGSSAASTTSTTSSRPHSASFGNVRTAGTAR
ncbi:NERD domain-containing protein [Actinomadura sediminis]|uniref:NERD domain-containing protein n=1 Tax=Actinomadura sediminis TaxID=1038904 RepID=A0ABW3EH11_9ACTN